MTILLYSVIYLMKAAALQFHGVDVDEAIDDGIDGQSCWAVNLELLCNVAAVGDDGVDRDA